MEYSSPVIQFRDSENKSAGASTNISSGLASDSEMIWGDSPAMSLWSSRVADSSPALCAGSLAATTGHLTVGQGGVRFRAPVVLAMT
jgi:hypothetical protein